MKYQIAILKIVMTIINFEALYAIVCSGKSMFFSILTSYSEPPRRGRLPRCRPSAALAGQPGSRQHHNERDDSGDDDDDADDDDDDDAISPFLIMPTLGGDDCYALCGPGLNFCCSFIGSFHQQMQRI